MSRCFPFPPPGYEKKPRPDDANLLIKEKHREKKHKKEKKDKDKKERKEKKDKERSRETKEKKNKHKDKKDKGRDRDKNKDKKRTSEEKNVLGAPENQNGASSCSTVIQSSESKPTFLLEPEKRLRNDDASIESKMVAEIMSADHSSIRFQGKVMENAFDVLSNWKDKCKDNREDPRRVNGQILKVVTRGLENGVYPNVKGENQKKIGGGVLQVEKVDEKRNEQKEKRSDKHRDAKGDKHQDRDQTKKNKPVGWKRERKKEEQNATEEKSKLQVKRSCIDTSNLNGNGLPYLPTESTRIKGNLGKRKDPEPNKVLHDDFSRPNKLSRPDSSSSHTIQNGSKHDPSKTAVRLGLERDITVQDHQVNSEVSSSQSVLQNARKTDPGYTLNGFMSVTKITINNHKVQNSPLLSRPFAGTGHKVESCQADINSTDSGPGVVSNCKLTTPQDEVEKQSGSTGGQATIHSTAEMQGILGQLKMNGKKHSVNSLVKSEESKKVEEESKIHKRPPHPDSKRPPHPDSKYLSQILTVPQVEWSNIDDQEWLFSSAKKPRTVSSKIDETTKVVWSEALQIESADVVALPYVLPY